MPDSLCLLAFFVFLYNIVGGILRRFAQFRTSKHTQRAKHLFQNILQDAVLALVVTTMDIMSWLYLIASERTSGSVDILINGVLYPASCACFRVLLHMIHQKSLQKIYNQDHDRLLEVAGLTSSFIVSCLLGIRLTFLPQRKLR